ncbi:MAG: DoxX family protein [Planctomycetes bacterium]|nr:DoxX family protein [Planctomycetota bacterium]MCB9886408.1 DoxX family protein [Planctomycetota bacterium]
MKLSPHAYGLAFARISLGVISLVHGIANTFGIWGGPDVERVAGDVAAQLATDSNLITTAVSLLQLLLGVLLVFGPLARIAAITLLALVVVHFFGSARWQAFFVRDDGFEFLLAVMALAVIIATQGPGAFCAKLRLRSPKKQKKE